MTTHVLPPLGTQEPAHTPGPTDLEVYLALVTRPVDSGSTPAQVSATAAAVRILDALGSHEAAVLCDLGHYPGARRRSSLWLEIDRAAASASPSVRMVARMVTGHLASHERSLMGTDQTVPAIEVLTGGGDDTTPDSHDDLTAILDVVSGTRTFFLGGDPEPA
ncbi:hypothetical protein [Nocardioides pakistanensis]